MGRTRGLAHACTPQKHNVSHIHELSGTGDKGTKVTLGGADFPNL